LVRPELAQELELALAQELGLALAQELAQELELVQVLEPRRQPSSRLTAIPAGLIIF